MLKTHSDSDVKFPSDIPDLCLYFTKQRVEKIHSHTQVVLNIWKSFPLTELSIHF